MALDGIFLRHIVKEIKEFALLSRVEKIYQPNKEEIVIFLRGRNGAKKLLLSARANSPRIGFTNYAPENPKTPPMLCMLLRKKLGSGKITDVYQKELERVVFIDFEAVNELGDIEKLTLITEIMGKYSNVILTDANGIIIDSLKRVDMSMSSMRLVLPMVTYQMPPSQDKLSILDHSTHDIINRVKSLPGEKHLDKAILDSVQGVSPVICREIAYSVSPMKELTNRTLSEYDEQKLGFHLKKLYDTAHNLTGEPFLISRSDRTPVDISFTSINQYGSGAIIKKFESFSELLDSFYNERDTLERMKARSQDLLKIISNTIERLSRKIEAQRQELLQCADREKLRICADLIQANLYSIERGKSEVLLDNFYSETGEKLKVKLDVTLTPAQNSQKYYKDYRKAKTAEGILKEQINKATSEIEYLETVFDSLTRCENESDLSQIRLELSESGYIKRQNSKQKPPKPLAPHEFTSSDGFKILVGRNNHQNDKLTLKTADKNDMWFHTKNIPGSHTIVISNGREIPDTTILEAARLAAFHSKAKNSSRVPVDYTLVKNVSKPQGAKPGMVIYVKNQTVYVTPESIERQNNE